MHWLYEIHLHSHMRCACLSWLVSQATQRVGKLMVAPGTERWILSNSREQSRLCLLILHTWTASLPGLAFLAAFSEGCEGMSPLHPHNFEPSPMSSVTIIDLSVSGLNISHHIPGIWQRSDI